MHNPFSLTNQDREDALKAIKLLNPDLTDKEVHTCLWYATSADSFRAKWHHDGDGRPAGRAREYRKNGLPTLKEAIKMKEEQEAEVAANQDFVLGIVAFILSLVAFIALMGGFSQ